MKRLIAVVSLAFALSGMLAAPASAHIERGINCHMNSATQSGHFVHVSLRITNRTTHTERLGCQVKLVSDTHYRKDWSIRTISGRHYRTVRYTVRLGGTFQRWVITHGHVF